MSEPAKTESFEHMHPRQQCVAAFRSELEHYITVHEGYHRAKDEQLLTALGFINEQLAAIREDLKARVSALEAELAALKPKKVNGAAVGGSA